MAKRKSQYIKWYELEEALQLAHHNRLKYCYPQAIGAIDGTHIAITPSDGYSNFICRKQYPSIVLQAVVDPHFKFRNIYCNTSGSAHDATVFHRSPLAGFLDARLPKHDLMINDVAVPLHILGDPAYPISAHIMKGYPGKNLTPAQESYNVYLSSSRMSVEIAFGRLKSRWRCLSKRLDVAYTVVPLLITTCCMLHNICESLKTPVPPAVQELFQQPVTISDLTTDKEAQPIREAIKDHLSANYPLRKSFHC
ncbi:uncharacterized protein [Watersipora subatra]|uniref:uncharacterized protein n=1 Tax=Watersipora subatra TaxID=2589382 RepID=UPI00355BCC77